MNDIVSAPQFRLRPPQTDVLGLSPSDDEIFSYFCRKYRQPDGFDESPAVRLRHGFLAASDYYELLVSKLVTAETRWLDVGCGRAIFPSNYREAKALAERCEYLVGIDPDPNVHENDLLTERFQGSIEEYASERKFNLVTMRMVAEHITNADETVRKLAELVDPFGLVVIFTPWKWAPMSIVASIIPYKLHNPLKRLIWDSEARDTFPTAYRMNTRRTLLSLFGSHAFKEVFFCRVDDCSVLTRFPRLNALEIGTRNTLLSLGIPYPEHCLLAVYQKTT